VYVDHCAQLSGGELALARLLPALTDVDAHVILGEDGPLRELLESQSIVVEVMSMDNVVRDVRRSQVSSPLASARAAAVAFTYSVRLAQRLRFLRPDIVHTNSLKAGFYGSVAARLARVPVVWHLRDRIARDYLPLYAVVLTRAALWVLPSVVVCNSDATRQTAGPAGRGARVVPSCTTIDVSDRNVKFGSDYAGDQTVIFGIVGRLAEWKGQHIFLRALATVAESGLPVRGRIIGSALFGEDEYADSLVRLAADLRIGELVEFRGFREDVASELSTIDVLVHASTIPEPFGQVVVEGMAAGLPVIASDAGGVREIITSGIDGLLVNCNDAAHLSAAMESLAADEDLRERLGEAAIARATYFSSTSVGRMMDDIYRAVVAS